MIKTILWDIDRTLLDFDLCERNSLKAQFEKNHLPPCTPEIQALYARINIKYWDMLERREITKEQVLVKRFDELFAVLGIEGVRSEQFTVDYENGIADTTAFIENSPEILASLKGKYRQYAVTNGAYNVQTKRLHNAGFDEIFSDFRRILAVNRHLRVIAFEQPYSFAFIQIYCRIDIHTVSSVRQE